MCFELIFPVDSILSAGLEENEEDDSDPFIPQERIFSKYAAMLYTSNNQGRSFEEFKEAKFCQSCGEKVGSFLLSFTLNPLHPGYFFMLYAGLVLFRLLHNFRL